ncbi:hypothetical protein IFM89_014565 [Coptis chinensis]|uniref:Pre-mRNA-splicing factor SLU7 n=1 Tax=Coptis chinensis TaxID=261450 RepID=A0A835GWH6_9MAGN|nr:hypothetical protein IFM89_014565 [Coptis chinensis]
MVFRTSNFYFKHRFLLQFSLFYLSFVLEWLKASLKWKSDPNYTKAWYDRGAKVHQAEKYRKGACENCGAITHDGKACMDRPRKKGAKWTNMYIAPDEKIETFELDYVGKRDRWNGYDTATFAHVIEIYKARDEARRKYLKEQQRKKLEEKNSNPSEQVEVSEEEEDEDEDSLKVDEAKVDESKQMDFAKVEKCVRTTGGGSTGTVSLNSSYKNYKVIKEKLKSKTKDTIMEKYGNAAAEEEIPKELLLGQSEKQVKYDRAGRVIKDQTSRAVGTLRSM